MISSLFGLCNSAVHENNRNTNPPITVTVFTDIFCAINFPPITAIAVQMACPIMPPMVTPYGSYTMYNTSVLKLGD